MKNTSVYFIFFVFVCIALYGAAPTVTTISPISGPAAGGTVVTLTGTSFNTATAVDFGAIAASSFIVVDDATIQATSPPGVAGNVNIVVTNPDGTSTAARGNNFTYTGNWTLYIDEAADSFSVIATSYIHAIELPLPGVDIATPSTTPPFKPIVANTFTFCLTQDAKNVLSNVCQNPGNNTGVLIMNASDNSLNQYNDLTANVFPQGITVTPDDTTAFIATQDTDTLGVFDITSTTFLARTPHIGFTGHLAAYSKNSNLVYIIGVSSPNYAHYNRMTSLVTTSAGIFPEAAFDFCITADGVNAYFTFPNTPNVQVYDVTTPTPTFSANIALPNTLGIAIAPTLNRAYILGNGGTLTDVDLSTNSVINTTPGFGSMLYIAVAPDEKTVYAIGGSNTQLKSMDTTSYAVTTTPVVYNGTGLVTNLVISADQSPVAVFTVVTAQSGSPTLFDGTGSVSPVGSIVSWHWDFGDGHTETNLIGTTTHTYAVAGNYTVTLTVTNSAGTTFTGSALDSQVFTGINTIRYGTSLAQLSRGITITSPVVPVTRPLPPRHFEEKLVKNRFLVQTNWTAFLSWRPSLSPDVVRYILYRDGKRIAVISAQAPYRFTDYAARERSVYQLVSVNANGEISLPIFAEKESSSTF